MVGVFQLDYEWIMNGLLDLKKLRIHQWEFLFNYLMISFAKACCLHDVYSL